MNIKITNLKLLLLLAVVLNSTYSHSQKLKDFSVRFDTIINGKFTTIGNNVLSKDSTEDYNDRSDGNGIQVNDNGFIYMKYVDIDDLDMDTNGSLSFNSSSAQFANPNVECFKVSKVLLYWAASDFETDTTTKLGANKNNVINDVNWNHDQVKIMLPGQSQYKTITADKTIYRSRDKFKHFGYDPYVCVKDITKEVSQLTSPFGDYQVANVKSATGLLQVDHDNRLSGLFGGWQIVFVYEYLGAPSQLITLFDGFTQIRINQNSSNTITESFDIEGFKAVPNGDVNASVLFGALDGEHNLTGDKLQIRQKNTNTFVDIGNTSLRPNNNFFNSRITIDDKEFLARKPASKNTLGFDAGIFKLDNSGNSIIGNNQDKTTVRIVTEKDSYGMYLFGFSIENYQPDLNPIKTSSSVGNNAQVGPNDVITNIVEFKNNGNDNAKNVIFKTTIANQLNLVQPIINLPTGITYTFDEAKRELQFKIANNLVKTAGSLLSFNYQTKVKDACYFLVENCNDLSFSSQIEATYQGDLNDNPKTTLSSSEVSKCSSNFEANKYTIKITPPAWLGDLNRTVECDDDEGLKAAQALLPKLSPDCDGIQKFITKIPGEFKQTNDDCASEGYYENTFNYKDNCGNVLKAFKQRIKVIDTTPPVLTDCSGKLTDLILDCGKKDDLQQQADDWHKKNIAAILQCASDNCSEIAASNIKSNYTFKVTNRPICEVDGESTPIKYEIFDACGTAKPLVKVLNIIYKDQTGPDTTLCEDKIKAIVEEECSGKDPLTLINELNAENIKALKGCAKDDCNPEIEVKVIDSIGDITQKCGKTFSVDLFYYALDECKNKSKVVKSTLIIKDTTGPQISQECINSLEGQGECDAEASKEEALAWSNENIEKLKACATDLCSNIKSITDNFNFDNYIITDCGGQLDVEYYITDECDITTTVKGSYYTGDKQPPLLTCTFNEDDNLILECGENNHDAKIKEWKTKIYQKIKNCTKDECTPDLIPTITDNLDALVLKDPVDCGKQNASKNPVEFKVFDNCDNFRPLNLTIYVQDTKGPEITKGCEPKDIIFKCEGIDTTINDIKAWDLQNQQKLKECVIDGCAQKAKITITSDLDIDKLPEPGCVGQGQKMPVTYTLSDGCNKTSYTINIAIEDSTPPFISDKCLNTIPTIIECDSQNNEQLIRDWNKKNLQLIKDCAEDGCAITSQITVTSSIEDTIQIPNPGCDETQLEYVDVFYYVEDNCGNKQKYTVKIALQDNTPPTIDANCLSKIPTVLECDGNNNDKVIEKWHQDNLKILAGCANDGCAVASQIKVTSNIKKVQIPTPDCQGQAQPVDVIYSISDNCNNSQDYTLKIALEDTTPPNLSINLPSVVNIVCADVKKAPKLTYKDACNFKIQDTLIETSTYEGEQDKDFVITRTWKVWDNCNNTNQFTQTINVSSQTGLSNANDDRCIDDGLINLNDYIDINETVIKDWEFIDGPQKNITVNKDGTFDPMQVHIDSLGIYNFTYTATKGYCFEETNLKLKINDDCIVYPCSPDLFTISKAVTPNNDPYNEYFSVIGTRECEFQIDLKIFNRWGSIIYENGDYKNDWNGTTNKSSIGGNNKVTNGTYYYVIKLIDSGFEPFTGPIYIGTK